MCACRCGINVHMKDGKVAYIEGNRDHPVNTGVLCAKGSAGIMQHNSPVAPARAAEAHRPARLGRVRGDHLGRGACHRRRLAGAAARDRPAKAGLLHRPRPVAVLHLLLGAEFRHPELCRPWRFLLGQHGHRGHLHHGRRVLGVRPARLGPHQALPALRRGRGSRQQPDQDRHRQAQGARRPGGRRQPDPLGLQRRRRRLVRDHARHRRSAHPVAGP